MSEYTGLTSFISNL